MFSEKDAEKSDLGLTSPRIVLSRVKKPSQKVTAGDNKGQHIEESKSSVHSSDVPVGCGRRGASKFSDSNVITAQRRIHIALVAAALIQARSRVAKNKRSSGRPKKVHSDDPWGGGLSPSAKAFTMVQLTKFSSPRSVQNRDSIKSEYSADKRAKKGTDKDDGQGKTKVKREDNTDLEVKIVPKFPIEGSASRTFRSPSHAESDENVENVDLNEPRRRRGRPKKSFPVIDRNKEGNNGEVVISRKAIPVKKVTIIDGSATGPVKVDQDSKVGFPKGGRRSLPNEPKEIAKRDRRSLPASHTVQNNAKSIAEHQRKELSKRASSRGETKEKSISVGKGSTVKSGKTNDGSRPSKRLLKSRVFKEAAAYDAPLIRDVETGHRAVTVHKVIPAHLLKPVSLTGYKISTRYVKITPSKVVLTKLEVSPEEALNRLLVIEALLKAQKGGRKAVAGTGKVSGKTGKGRAKVKQEQPVEKTVCMILYPMQS